MSRIPPRISASSGVWALLALSLPSERREARAWHAVCVQSHRIPRWHSRDPPLSRQTAESVGLARIHTRVARRLQRPRARRCVMCLGSCRGICMARRWHSRQPLSKSTPRQSMADGAASLSLPIHSTLVIHFLRFSSLLPTRRRLLLACLPGPQHWRGVRRHPRSGATHCLDRGTQFRQRRAEIQLGGRRSAGSQGDKQAD